MRAELLQAPDIRTGGATVGDVADKRNGQTGEGAAALADGENVEEALRGMLMRAVATIDHRAIEIFRQKVRRAGRAVTNDNRIDVHGLDRLGRVDDGFALGD